MALIPLKRRHTRQPQSVFRADNSNPITKDLLGAFNFIGNYDPVNLCSCGEQVTPVWSNTRPAISAGMGGKGVSLTVDASSTNNHANLLDESQLGTTGCTILYIRRPRDTINRASSSFGVIYSNNNQRAGSHCPWIDGKIYWDFGGASGLNRLIWSGYTKSANVVDTFVFRAGTLGSSIWFNGDRKANQTTAITRNTGATNNNWYLGDGNVGSLGDVAGDAVDVLFVAVWNRELSDNEIKSVSDNPYQLLQPQTQYIEIAGAAASGFMPHWALTANRASMIGAR